MFNKKNKNLAPVHFKRPNASESPVSKKRRVSTSSEEDMQYTATGNQNEDYDDDDTQLFNAELSLEPAAFADDQGS